MPEHEDTARERDDRDEAGEPDVVDEDVLDEELDRALTSPAYRISRFVERLERDRRRRES